MTRMIAAPIAVANAIAHVATGRFTSPSRRLGCISTRMSRATRSHAHSLDESAQAGGRRPVHRPHAVQAPPLVRPIETARIWARDSAKAAAAAAAASTRLGIPVTAAASGAEAVAGADIVVTTTPSTTPLLMADWHQPGQHVTAMGSDAEHKNEVDPAAIARAGLHVADSLSQTRRLGELHHAIEAGLVAADANFPEIGQIVAGAPGRSGSDQITLSDLTGTGVQDTAIATLARQRAEAQGAGAAFTSRRQGRAGRFSLFDFRPFAGQWICHPPLRPAEFAAESEGGASARHS